MDRINTVSITRNTNNFAQVNFFLTAKTIKSIVPITNVSGKIINRHSKIKISLLEKKPVFSSKMILYKKPKTSKPIRNSTLYIVCFF